MSEEKLQEQMDKAIQEFNRDTIALRNEIYTLQGTIEGKTNEILDKQDLYGNISLANFHLHMFYIELIQKLLSLLNGKKILPTPLLHKFSKDIKEAMTDARLRIDKPGKNVEE